MSVHEYTMSCASRALKHGVSDSRVLTTPVRHRTYVTVTLIAILNHQNSTIKRSWFALSSRENVVCISYSGGMFWRYVQSVLSQCATREWALALFRNNHRACVLKRNTLELIIHWKRNASIYSLCHLLCNQLVFFFTLALLWTDCLNGFTCWITGLKTFPSHTHIYTVHSINEYTPSNT